MISKWIFTFDKVLNESQKSSLNEQLGIFLNVWDSHGISVVGEYKIYESQILEVSVNKDSEKPSGCSVDTLKRRIAQIADSLNLHFFSSNLVLFKIDGKYQGYKRSEIKSLLQLNQLSSDTEVLDFSSLEQVVSSDETNPYLKPLKNTWVNLYL